MGLDTVELVIAFEDEFGIIIKDDDATRMTTPAEVADHVIARVRTSADQPCPTQAGFHRLRKVLMASFGIPRKAIRPHTPLRELFKGDLRAIWPQLGAAVGAEHFPGLERTRRFVLVTVFLLPAAIVAPLFATAISVQATGFIYLGVVLLANAVTAKRGTEIPARLQTVEALVPYVGCASAVIWTRETALTRIMEITAEQLGLKVEQVRPDSRFVQDLGAD